MLKNNNATCEDNGQNKIMLVSIAWCAHGLHMCNVKRLRVYLLISSKSCFFYLLS